MIVIAPLVTIRSISKRIIFARWRILLFQYLMILLPANDACWVCQQSQEWNFLKDGKIKLWNGEKRKQHLRVEELVSFGHLIVLFSSHPHSHCVTAYFSFQNYFFISRIWNLLFIVEDRMNNVFKREEEEKIFFSFETRFHSFHIYFFQLLNSTKKKSSQKKRKKDRRGCLL